LVLSARAAHVVAIERLRQQLAGRVPQTCSIAGHVPAAVAVLLVNRGDVPHVPFTLRSTALPKHSGQISFPGGKLDPQDASLAACAVREAEEELGILPQHVTVLGELDDVPTPTGFTIRPVVCELNPQGALYRPNPGEVAEVFETPLTAFREHSIREDLGEREFAGIRYRMHAYHVAGHRIWGATARMVEQLMELLL
jgi:8-oxo-dGTP pyrophosphatase MutT (NUDIX family)